MIVGECISILNTKSRCQKYTLAHRENQKISICNIKYVFQSHVKVKTKGVNLKYPTELKYPRKSSLIYLPSAEITGRNTDNFDAPKQSQRW